jgi:DNA-binding NtrC family response regulator
MLSAYDWLGNVRELRNVVLRARDTAEAAGQGRILREHVAEAEPAILEALRRPRYGRHRYQEREREMILDALRVKKGNKSAAAQYLEMPRATFLRKLRKLGLDEAGGVVSN